MKNTEALHEIVTSEKQHILSKNGKVIGSFDKGTFSVAHVASFAFHFDRAEYLMFDNQVYSAEDFFVGPHSMKQLKKGD